MDEFFAGTFDHRGTGPEDTGESVWRVATAPAAFETERDEVFPDDGYYDEDYDG